MSLDTEMGWMKGKHISIPNSLLFCHLKEKFICGISEFLLQLEQES